MGGVTVDRFPRMIWDTHQTPAIESSEMMQHFVIRYLGNTGTHILLMATEVIGREKVLYIRDNSPNKMVVKAILSWYNEILNATSSGHQ